MLGVAGILSGCAALTVSHFEKLYGPVEPRERVIASLPPGHIDYWAEVKPILDNRCVVCHGCYDAPCQLKLTAIEGIERGASNLPVYKASRAKSAMPSRLFEDARSVEEWRNQGFFPVLNEYSDTLQANTSASAMYQLLDLKERNPLPREPLLSDEFTLGLYRKEMCPVNEAMPGFSAKHPLWGMPYALPGLEKSQQVIVKTWLEQGARYTPREPLAKQFTEKVKQWESLLNQDSLKRQLASRYIYEHLFLGHLYFSDLSEVRFFKIVRSETPPGQPPKLIATRRPYDDPGVARVYYRLIPEFETIVVKSHTPYALNQKRMDRWQALFFDADYSVSELPGYDLKRASNPFDAFQQMPINSRYKFMLDEAQFSIMNFMKGSVCRGQVALNVIRDRFWVFFIDPDVEQSALLEEAIESDFELLDFPSSKGDIFSPVKTWREYSAKQQKVLKKRNKFLRENFSKNGKLDLDIIWNGDGVNKNAALTIFRHFDSASVEKGLVGDPPQTAWIVGYTLLERIHYLLVAGYDVYGNYGHQLLSRLYMDFLRMDGEMNLLELLPKASRENEWNNWYRNAKSDVLDLMSQRRLDEEVETGVTYSTSDYKTELFQMLSNRLGTALSTRRELTTIRDNALVRELQRLSSFHGPQTIHIPELSFIHIVDQNTGEASQTGIDVTLIRNNAHQNITSLFREQKQLNFSENTVTVLAGLVGAFPNAFMKVPRSRITEYVDQVLSLDSEEDYADLMRKFGVRRTNPDFWEHADQVHQSLKAENIVEYGMLDFSRLENR